MEKDKHNPHVETTYIELTEEQLKDITNGEEIVLNFFVVNPQVVIRRKPVFEDDSIKGERCKECFLSQPWFNKIEAKKVFDKRYLDVPCKHHQKEVE